MLLFEVIFISIKKKNILSKYISNQVKELV